MEPQILTCPFCGAPYRESISLGTVQVNCRYCGGTLIVPPSFGGGGRSCANHSEVLAVGLCNDCEGSYCDSCLRFLEVEAGTLHLCPKCFRARKSAEASGAIIMGFVMLFFGAFIIAATRNPVAAVIIGVLYFGFIVVPFFGLGIYMTFHIPEGLTLKDRREAIKKMMEARKALGEQTPAFELYDRMLHHNVGAYGQQLGWKMLESDIDYYMKAGMTRSEAVRKVAEEKGY